MDPASKFKIRHFLKWTLKLIIVKNYNHLYIFCTFVKDIITNTFFNMLITLEQFSHHFDALTKAKFGINNDIPFTPLCPICLRPFLDQDQNRKATKEDAPPRSIEGTVVALTCKDCNSNCGAKIDFHLVNFVKHIDRVNFAKGSNRNIKIYDGNQILNGILSVGENKDLTMEIPKKINDPRTLEKTIMQWNPNKELSFSNIPLKLDKQNLNTAILKTSYILLFSMLGYSMLTWREYDKIREQILNPAKKLLPPLWTMQDIKLHDGIYYSNNGWLRGFFIIFSVTNKDTRLPRKFISFLPAPQTDFFVAHYFLNRIKIGERLRLGNLRNIDFLNNSQNIIQLNKWAYGDSLQIFVE